MSKFNFTVCGDGTIVPSVDLAALIGLAIEASQQVTLCCVALLALCQEGSSVSPEATAQMLDLASSTYHQYVEVSAYLSSVWGPVVDEVVAQGEQGL